MDSREWAQVAVGILAEPGAMVLNAVEGNPPSLPVEQTTGPVGTWRHA